MSISNEFAMAVKERNRLRVKIMLKDSLLADKSFKLFDEMQRYATNQGLSPWEDADPDNPLEKAEKPWTEDTMNYELTALINDFTNEHVEYIKEIISDIYITEAKTTYPSSETSKPSYETKPSPNSSQNNTTEYGKKRIDNPTAMILEEIGSINRILNYMKDPLTGKRRWYYSDIAMIKQHAQGILNACDEIERRR